MKELQVLQVASGMLSEALIACSGSAPLEWESLGFEYVPTKSHIRNEHRNNIESCCSMLLFQCLDVPCAMLPRLCKPSMFVCSPEASWLELLPCTCNIIPNAPCPCLFQRYLKPLLPGSRFACCQNWKNGEWNTGHTFRDPCNDT